ncbi:hypothetical protein L873DRAFT_474009 [Choiromyces venosus 120613-1]|uniref:Uncharacterized protein n=1 Tax=Choiromyces venosus 120613-1 TaxID=1336337 RepID=A0A3N4IWJ0_9PEZI|nr:hypothetical protein L873DRAFT_474009 [Choiromyces venosus 120613-1]
MTLSRNHSAGQPSPEYNPTANHLLRGMGNRFNQAITILSLVVGFFCSSIIGHYSLRIGYIAIMSEVTLLTVQSGDSIAIFSDAVHRELVFSSNLQASTDSAPWKVEYLQGWSYLSFGNLSVPNSPVRPSSPKDGTDSIIEGGPQDRRQGPIGVLVNILTAANYR